MIIIFDLDRTLIDTEKLRNELASIFNKENFKKDYQKYFKNRKINFNLETYLAILRSRGSINKLREEELRLRLVKLMNRLDDYLFPEVFNTLSRLKAGGTELILMTFGDKAWQGEKVKNLSIGRYFKQIIFAEENKARSEYLKSLKNTQAEVLIVNDNAREIREMIEIIGARAKVFLVAGPYVKNIKHDWPIHKLAELII